VPAEASGNNESNYSAHKSVSTFQTDLPSTKTFRTKSEVKTSHMGPKHVTMFRLF